MFRSLSRRLLPVCVLVGTACTHNGFNPIKFTSNDRLYEASLAELNKHKWDHAVAGFERLTTTLPARDPLLPQSFFYLGKAHQARQEYILAAQAFSRLPEAFPEDTLADDATFEAGKSYERLWRRPSLDAEYGETALSTFESFLAAYPDSPFREQAQKEIDHLNEWFAEKSFNTGRQYQRRKAYDSAIIYYKDVVRTWPGTKHAKMALVGLANSYRAIKYREELAETCTTMRQKYPGDGEVNSTCHGVRDADSALALPAQQPAQTPQPIAPESGTPQGDRSSVTPP